MKASKAKYVAWVLVHLVKTSVNKAAGGVFIRTVPKGHEYRNYVAGQIRKAKNGN